MKATIAKILRQVFEDRYFFVLIIVFLLFALLYLMMTGFAIKPSERQVISHYSAFGITHFYFDQWFYLLSFLAFGLIAAVMNTLIAIKILVDKGRSLAIAYIWTSISLIFLCWSMSSTVMSLRNLL